MEVKHGVLLTPTTHHLRAAHRTQVASRVWPKPGNEPLVDVDRTVLVTVHHHAAVLVLTAIRPFPQRHVLHVLAGMTHPGGIALINYREFFPKTQTLVFEHLHKAVEPPIIIDHAVAYAPLVPLFAGLVPLLLDDHLPLGKIANDHSPFSQFASDEVRCFVQTVPLFVALALGHPFVHAREMEVPAGFLLAAVPLGADFVELLVVPAVAPKAADVVEASLVVDARCQCFDAQVEGHNAIVLHGAHFPLLTWLVPIVFDALFRIVIHKRAVVVSPSIPGHGNLAKVVRGRFGEVRHDVRVAFGSPLATSTSGQDDGVALDLVQIHRGVTQGEELVPGLDPWKAWLLLAFRYPAKEGLHGFIQAKEHLCQEFAVHGVNLRVVLPALSQRLLRLLPSRPAFAIAQAHHPPAVEAPTFRLHEFKRCSVLLAHFNLDLFTQEHGIPSWLLAQSYQDDQMDQAWISR
jgi:hypothetical protein